MNSTVKKKPSNVSRVLPVRTQSSFPYKKSASSVLSPLENFSPKPLNLSLNYGAKSAVQDVPGLLARYYKEFIQRRSSRLKRLKFVLNYRAKRLSRIIQRGLRRLSRRSLKPSRKQSKAVDLAAVHSKFSRWLVDSEGLFGGSTADQAFALFDYRTWLVSSALLHSFNSNGGLGASGFILPTPLAHNSGVTAETILRYSLIRLGKYHLPSEIFPALLKSSVNYFNYTTLDDIRGLSIVCSGRINRKQMASRVKFQIGAASKGTIESPLDYAQGVVSLKYGTVGVKVYLTQNSFSLNE